MALSIFVSDCQLNVISQNTSPISCNQPLPFFLYILVLFISTISLITPFILAKWKKKLPQKTVSEDKRTVQYHSFCTGSRE